MADITGRLDPDGTVTLTLSGEDAAVIRVDIAHVYHAEPATNALFAVLFALSERGTVEATRNPADTEFQRSF